MTKPVAGFIFRFKESAPIPRPVKPIGKHIKRISNKKFVDFDNLDQSQVQPVFIFSLKDKIQNEQKSKTNKTTNDIKHDITTNNISEKHSIKRNITTNETTQAIKNPPEIESVPKRKNVEIPLPSEHSIRHDPIDNQFFHDSLIKDFSIFNEPRAIFQETQNIKRSKIVDNEEAQTEQQKCNEQQSFTQEECNGQLKPDRQPLPKQNAVSFDPSVEHQACYKTKPIEEQQSVPAHSKVEQHVTLQTEISQTNERQNNLQEKCHKTDVLAPDSEGNVNIQPEETPQLSVEQKAIVRSETKQFENISPLKYYMLVDKSLPLNDQLTTLLDMSMSFLVTTQGVSHLEFPIQFNQKIDEEITEVEQSIDRIKGEIEKWENIGKEFINENKQQIRVGQVLELLENCNYKEEHILKGINSKYGGNLKEANSMDCDVISSRDESRIGPEDSNVIGPRDENTQNELTRNENNDTKNCSRMCNTTYIAEQHCIEDKNNYLQRATAISDEHSIYYNHVISQHRRVSHMLARIGRYISFISMESGDLFRKLFILLKKKRVKPLLVLRTMAQLKQVDYHER